jgi:hypothetical protein
MKRSLPGDGAVGERSMKQTARAMWAAVLAATAAVTCGAQGLSLANGGSLIGPTDLISPFAASLQAMGGRMTNASTAQVTLSGTVTTNAGSRSAQLTIQAPGYFAYRDNSGVVIAFNGTAVQTNSGAISSALEPIWESLLANFPDAIYLQVASGGSLRRLGAHFRTSGGNSGNYTGPYWTVFAFSPKPRGGLSPGGGLQQPLFIAIDEHTGFISDVRVVLNSGPGQQTVIQTEFENWTQVGGQWFPGKVVRLENSVQMLSFQTQTASVGAALNLLTFLP